MLELRDVTFAYAAADGSTARPALAELSLDVPVGTTLGIVGAAGAGKSTLSNLLAGFVPHFYQGTLQGQVRWQGRGLSETPHAAWLEHVGIVFQDPYSQLTGARFTVAEEVAFALENAGVDPLEMQERVAALLDEAGLAHLAERHPRSLSGGQQQLVVLASILVGEPSLLVLDEPTAQLDPQATTRVHELLRCWQRKGTTIIVADQHAESLAPWCDALAVLEQGCLKAYGPPHLVLADRSLGTTWHAIRRPARYELVELSRARGLWPGDLPDPSSDDEAVEGWRLRLEPGPGVDAAAALSSSELQHDSLPLKAEPGSGAGRARGSGDGAGARALEAPPAAEQGGREVARAASLRLAPLLRVEDLHFAYSIPGQAQAGQAVLRGVSLELGAGERVALLGPNGAGKSTLARLLCGLIAPSAGRVSIGGTDLSTLQGGGGGLVAYAHQNPDVQLFTRTVWDDVAFGPRQQGRRGPELEEVVLRAARLARVEALLDENPRDLGYSERKRVVLAAVLAMETPVVLLDEPTGNLDASELGHLAEALGKVQAKGASVLVITHDLRFVAEHFDRALVMVAGELVADATPAEILSNDALCARAGLKPTAALGLARRLRAVSPIYAEQEGEPASCRGFVQLLARAAAGGPSRSA